MLDIKFIREDFQKVKNACVKKRAVVDVDKILDLDKKKRELLVETEKLKAEQNKISRGGVENKVLIEQAREIKEKIKCLAPELEKTENELNELLARVPNIPFDDVPVGKDDSENVIMRQVGKIPKFKFAAKDYMQIGTELDLIDTERAAKVAGSDILKINWQFLNLP